MDPKSFTRIERLNYLLGALLIGATVIFGSQYQALGVLVGVLVTCINFTIIRRLANRLIKLAPDRRAGTAFLFAPKMAALLAAVALALYFLPISPIGVAIGFSVFLISITIETIRYLFSNQSILT